MSKNEQVTVKATQRDKRGKNDARKMRREGYVPISIYGGEGEAVAAKASLADLAAIIRSATGANTIFTIDVEGVGESEVMFHDRQIHPLKGRLMHADFKRIVRGQKLEVTVPISLEGEPEGVKNEDGILNQTLQEVVVRCLPRHVPDHIHQDVSGMHVNDVLHAGDLTLSEGVELVTEPDAVVATIGYVSEAELEEALTPQLDREEPVVTEQDNVEKSE